MEISRVLAKLHISSNLIHLQEQNLKIRIIKRLFSRKVQTFDRKLSHCGRGLNEWLWWHKNLIDVTLSPSLPIKRDMTHGRLQISLEMASCAWTGASVFSFLNNLYRLYIFKHIKPRKLAYKNRWIWLSGLMNFQTTLYSPYVSLKWSTADIFSKNQENHDADVDKLTESI